MIVGRYSSKENHEMLINNSILQQRSQNYSFDKSYELKDISEEIISKLEELNNRLDKVLKKGDYENE